MKLSKAQRLAFGRLCTNAFLQLEHISTGMKWDEFPMALTDEQKDEVTKLRKLTFALAKRWRELAWELRVGTK